jgi:DHA2 family multidrug resistance protein
MRNIGSSVGTSMVTTLLAQRSQLHQNRIVEFTRTDSFTFRNSFNGLTQQFVQSGLSVPDARGAAAASFYQSVQAQASTLAYIDTFYVLCLGAAIMFVLSFLLKKNEPGSGSVAAV